jgi:hypothetical protein
MLRELRSRNRQIAYRGDIPASGYRHPSDKSQLPGTPSLGSY